MRKAFRAVVLLVLAGSALGAPSREGLKAGTGKVKITPEEPVMLAGYGSRNKPSEGVAADLYARALALDDGEAKTVLVTADIIGFGPVISRAIKKEARSRFGLPEERLLLVGSHTHSGPVISERALVDHPEQEKAKDRFVDGLRAKILEAVGLALGALAPARLEMARGEARLGSYRRVPKPDGTWAFGDNPEGIVDPDLPLLVVRGMDDSLRAVAFTYACHCTSVRYGKEGFYLIHPDWALCASKLEEKHPGAQVMFVTGCGGDIDPGPKGSIATAEGNAATMEEAIGKGLKEGSFRPIHGPIGAQLRRIDLPLEDPSREAFQKMVESGKPAEQRFAKEQLRKMDEGTLPRSISYPILIWRFARDLTLVALAGETCVEYALRLKRELGPKTTWVAGYSNEVMCYIPSERVLGENGYESGWTLRLGRGIATSQMSGSGWPTPFARGLEDRIVGTVREMAKP
jgi:hypothetical protein